jgi:4-hydroxy-3-polyprenylbenzoate decarboxylase
MDTLDYSGDGLNAGSKVVFAAAGTKKRTLGRELPANFELPRPFNQAKFVIPGVIAIDGQAFSTYENESKIMAEWCRAAAASSWEGFPLIVLCDDANFTAATVNNFVWTTFTRSNPAYDIYGINSFTAFKHWGCEGPLIIDARTKPHHAPALIKDEAVERRVDQLAAKGGSLHGVI